MTLCQHMDSPGPGQRAKVLPRAAAVLVTAVLSAGCGGQPPSRSVDASPNQPSTAASSEAADLSHSATLEQASAAGLAEAAMRHLGGQHAAVVGGSQNRDEGWTAVDLEANRRGTPVELRLFVTNIAEPTKRPSARAAGDCPTSHVVIFCRTETAPNGSPVTLQASTEDIVGGDFGHGFSADVYHLRDHSAVLVSEILPTRKQSFVKMTGLPVPVEVLESIASDPHVGTQTTPELNRTGKRKYHRMIDDGPR